MTAVTLGSAELLAPCPFCGKPLTIGSRKINPKAYCETEDCYGQKMSVVNLDDPVCVKAWNTRLAAAKPDEDPVDVWGAYCEEVPAHRRSPQGALAFGFEAGAKPDEDGVRGAPEVIAARICEKIWSKKYQTLRTMEKVSIAEDEIVKAIKAERALSTTGKPKRCQ